MTYLALFMTFQLFKLKQSINKRTLALKCGFGVNFFSGLEKSQTFCKVLQRTEIPTVFLIEILMMKITKYHASTMHI